MANSDGAAFRRALEDALDAATPAERRPAVAAVLARFLSARSTPTLVGGGAVEFYTQGAYQTGDIDLIGDRKATGRLLESGGFVRAGRLWIDEALGLAIEVPGSRIGATEESRDFEVPGGTATVIAVEDLVVDRLNAAKWWRSATDWEQALLVYGAQRNQIDRARLRTRAEEEGVVDYLDELEAVVHEHGDEDGGGA